MADPTPTLPSFAALRAFAMVGRSGGIRKAAEALGISHAIVSRHMAGMEENLGVLLLNRRTGQLTAAGRDYHGRVAAAIADLESATKAARGHRAAPLTIWCSPGFSVHWLARRLPDFAGRPQGARERRVIDLRSADSAPDFDANEVDGDIRYVPDSDPPPPSGVRTLELARVPIFPVAAPDLLARLRKPIATVADLLNMPLIEESAPVEWPGWLAAQGGDVAALPPPVARYGQAHLALAAARAGQGAALSNHFLAQEDLASGRLVRLVPQDQPLVPVTLGTYVFRCGRARWSEPMVSRFRQWLETAIAADIEPPPTR